MRDGEDPAWRYGVVGLLSLALVAYMLATGELAVDKQKTMSITRAADPLLYWPIVGAAGVLGALALRAAWRRLAS